MHHENVEYTCCGIGGKVVAMRINCPECDSKAYISSRKTLSREVTDIYCSCSSVECGHTFVSTLSFKHTISPSKQKVDSLVGQLLKTLPYSQIQQILEDNNISAS